MPKFAISDGSKIINIIVAESEEIAQKVSGMEVVEVTNGPEIGWTLEDDGWRPQSPYASWLWDSEVRQWVPPIAKPVKPGFSYIWDEEGLSWQEQEMPSPYPSWIKDESGEWVPPVPFPTTGAWDWDEATTSWVEADRDNMGDN